MGKPSVNINSSEVLSKKLASARKYYLKILLQGALYKIFFSLRFQPVSFFLFDSK